MRNQRKGVIFVFAVALLVILGSLQTSWVPEIEDEKPALVAPDIPAVLTKVNTTRSPASLNEFHALLPQPTIDVDVIYEIVDSENSGWQNFARAEWPSRYLNLKSNVTRVQRDQVLDVFDADGAPHSMFLLSLRSVVRHLVCQGGDCCNSSLRSGIRVRQLTLIVPSIMHLPLWVTAVANEHFQHQSDCVPQLRIVTHDDLVRELNLDEIEVLPTYNTFAVQAMLHAAPRSSRFALLVPVSAVFCKDIKWSHLFTSLGRGGERIFLPRPSRSHSLDTARVSQQADAMKHLRSFTDAGHINTAEPEIAGQRKNVSLTLLADEWKLDDEERQKHYKEREALDIASAVHVIDLQLLSKMFRFPGPAGIGLRSTVSVRTPSRVKQAMPLFMHDLMVLRETQRFLGDGHSSSHFADEAPMMNLRIRIRTSKDAEHLVTPWTLVRSDPQLNVTVMVISNHITQVRRTPHTSIHQFVANIAIPRFFPSASPWELPSINMSAIAVTELEEENNEHVFVTAPDDSQLVSSACAANRSLTLQRKIEIDAAPIYPPQVEHDGFGGVATFSASVEAAVKRMCWLPRSRNATVAERINERLSKQLKDLDELFDERTQGVQPVVEVDVVYTYVNGNAVEWLKVVADFQRSIEMGFDASRFRDWDELRYSLRSVNEYLCRHGDCCGEQTGLRIGTVYIVVATLEHIPSWMANFTVGPRRANQRAPERPLCVPELRIITHDMIFPGAGNNPEIGEHERDEELLAEFLPTFQSMSIETCLHRIPGLSRYFIYLNNDFMFGRPLHITDFFRPYYTWNSSGKDTKQSIAIELEPLLFSEGPIDTIEKLRCQRRSGVKDFHERVNHIRHIEEAFVHSPKCSLRKQTALQCNKFKRLNSWLRTGYFNLGLTCDRLAQLRVFTEYPHVPMLMEKNLLHSLLDVRFRDVTYTTRKGKLRSTTHIASVYLYRFYAAAQRVDRSAVGVERSQLCHKPPVNRTKEFEHTYFRWYHFPYFPTDTGGVAEFLQVGSRGDPRAHADRYRQGSIRRTKLVAVNDNLHPDVKTSDAEVMNGFKDLLQEMVNRAKVSPWELQ